MKKHVLVKQGIVYITVLSFLFGNAIPLFSEETPTPETVEEPSIEQEATEQTPVEEQQEPPQETNEEEATEEVPETTETEETPSENNEQEYEYDFSDTQQWTDLCTGEAALTAEEKNSCTAFMDYMSDQSVNLKEKIEELEAQRAQIAANISYYGQQVMKYQSQADALNSEIMEMTNDIAVKEKEIEMLEEKQQQKEQEIEEAKEKVKERMILAQESMRLNQYFDVLMGAKTLNDFVRIANGLNDITSYDQKTMDELDALVKELEANRIEIEKQKDLVVEKRAEVVDKQNQILAMKYEAQVVEEEYRKQAADLVALGNKYAADIEAFQALMREITEKLNEVTAAPGWTYPLAAGHLYPGAGTWHYASGGLHFGGDYAAPKGTALLAAGNGVILNSVNGCGDGWIGNGCVGPGGTWGGGNQIDALFKINGSLYAVKYSHMLINTPIPKGTIVMAGDKVGEVGMSGNASGPHSHIEVYYLGDAKLFTEYATNWDGNLSFHCEWRQAALNHVCETNGNVAPCRVRPETVFGE